MADQLRPNPFRPVQNFAAPGVPNQPRPEHPPQYRQVQADKKLPEHTRHYGSTTTNPRGLNTHNITSRESSSSSYLKSHTGINTGPSGSGTSSQQASRSHIHPGTSSKPTSSPAVEDLFSHPSISNPSYSQHTPRQPSVSSQHESRSSSMRTESHSSSRTSLPSSHQTNPGHLRTTFRETTT